MSTAEIRQPIPPFTRESALLKVRLAEDGWNSRDAAKVALAYTPGYQVTQPRRINGHRQGVILAQGGGKTHLAVGRHVLEQRVQLSFQPMRLKVEHGIGKAFLGRRMPIVDFPWLQHKYLARRTEMANTPAIELLHPLFGYPYQKAVMPMRIVGMPLEMGANRLNPGIGILGQLNPVACIHG